MGEQLVEQRRAFLLRQALDRRGQHPADVERGAARLLMGDDHRVGRPRRVVGDREPLLEGGRDVAAGIEAVRRAQAGDPFLRRRREGLVGAVHVGEQRMPAHRGDGERVQHRVAVGALVIRAVGVEIHLAFGQRPDRLAVLPGVGDHHDRAVADAFAGGLAVDGAVGQVAEQPGEADLVGLRHVLAGEDQHLAVEPGGVDRLARRAVDAARQVDAVDARAERRVEGFDADGHPRSSHASAGRASAGTRSPIRSRRGSTSSRK